MKTHTKIMLAGALALSITVTGALAGSRTTVASYAHGNPQFRTTPPQSEMTVALYLTDRPVVRTEVAPSEKGERRILQTQGRAGFKPLIVR